MKAAFPLKLNRSIPFVDAILRIIEGTGTEVEAAHLLSDAESQSEVEFVSKERSQALEQIPVERYQEVVEGRMNMFLSRSHLVLGSADYDRLCVIIAGRYGYSWTHRECGHMMASWANGIRWRNRDEWSYLDFYGGLNDSVVENYDVWCATAMRVIEIKSGLKI